MFAIVSVSIDLNCYCWLLFKSYLVSMFGGGEPLNAIIKSMIIRSSVELVISYYNACSLKSSLLVVYTEVLALVFRALVPSLCPPLAQLTFLLF